jgi:hypothetical protein
MSTIRRLPQAQKARVIGQWLPGIPPSDCRSGTRNIGLLPQHAVTACAHIAPANPANENWEWDGGFDCHLGVYGRV